MIRLSRQGKKHKPFFRVVVSEKHKDPYGKAREIVGYVNPGTNPREINIKEDRVKYWLSKGAQASPTVHNILVDLKLVDGKKKVKKNPPKKEEVAEEKPAETPVEAPSEAPKEAENTEKKEETEVKEVATEEPKEEEKADN